MEKSYSPRDEFKKESLIKDRPSHVAHVPNKIKKGGEYLRLAPPNVLPLFRLSEGILMLRLL